MAAILDATVARATQLDRAMGYRANTEGTSYLNAPLEMLGSLQVAAPSVNIRACGSMQGGAATVKWDNEGVAPTDAMLVTKEHALSTRTVLTVRRLSKFCICDLPVSLSAGRQFRTA